MEGTGAAAELQDWEVLHPSDSDEPTPTLDPVGDDSHGAIRSDYFSLHSDFARPDAAEESSVESDGPSWIDPDPPERSNSGGAADFWPDSGSDRSETQRSRDLSDFDGKPELGFAEDANPQVGFQGIDGIPTQSGGSGVELDRPTELGFLQNVKSGVGSEGIDESGESLGVKSEDGGQLPVEVSLRGYAETQKVSGVLGENCDGDGLIVEVQVQNEGANGCGDGESQENETADATEEEMKSVGGVAQGRAVWWKLPFEFIKFCIFRVSPIWSFSVAAAVMGFVLLGRRLYKMKRKRQGMQLKVTVDDKKVSQFMSRAARLNEAFSIVRRVPIVRPSLPAAGITTWPVMSLR